MGRSAHIKVFIRIAPPPHGASSIATCPPPLNASFPSAAAVCINNGGAVGRTAKETMVESTKSQSGLHKAARSASVFACSQAFEPHHTNDYV